MGTHKGWKRTQYRWKSRDAPHGGATSGSSKPLEQFPRPAPVTPPYGAFTPAATPTTPPSDLEQTLADTPTTGAQPGGYATPAQQARNSGQQYEGQQ